MSHLVSHEAPLASLNIAPIDIDEIAPLPPRQNVLVSSGLDVPNIPAVIVTTPLSASKLRLLQDTTMIESALDLDSLEDASVDRGSQAGLIKIGAVWDFLILSLAQFINLFIHSVARCWIPDAQWSRNGFPWRKNRIEIYSEPIRNFPNHSGIYIRTKQFHSDLIRS